MRHHRRAVLKPDVEHQAVTVNAEMQRVRSAVMADRRKRIHFEQIVNRDLPFVIDIGAGASDRRVVKGDGNKALRARGGRCFSRAHFKLRRIATERA